MSVDLNRAFMLLSIVEKAASHPYLRGEALHQLSGLEAMSMKEAKARDEAAAEEAAKAVVVKTTEPEVDKASASEPEMDRRL